MPFIALETEKKQNSFIPLEDISPKKGFIPFDNQPSASDLRVDLNKPIERPEYTGPKPIGMGEVTNPFEVLQTAQHGVEAAKEYIPQKIVKSEFGAQHPNIAAGAATTAKVIADIGEFMLLPSGKLKMLGEGVAKYGGMRIFGKKGIGKEFETYAKRIPQTMTKGAQFGALMPAETLQETAFNAAQMALFTGLVESGIGSMLARNTVNKLTANTKAAGGKLPESPEAIQQAVAEVKDKVETVKPTEKPATPGIDQKLAERLAEKTQQEKTVGQAGHVTISPEKAPPSFIKLDSEVEGRIQKAKSGIVREGMVDHIKEYAKDFLHGFTRPHKDLPYDTRFAITNFEIARMGSARQRGARSASENLQAIVGNYGTAEADLFAKKLLIEDAIESVAVSKTRGEKVKLGFGFTEENLPRFKKTIDSELAKRPDVAQDVGLYYEKHQSLSKQYVDAFKDLGVDLSDNFAREKYLRHQILAYAEKTNLSGGGKGLKTKVWRNFLKRRYGSEHDYNTNVVQPIYEVWAQMETDIRWAQSMKLIKDTEDVIPALKKEISKRRVNTIKGIYARGQFIDEAYNLGLEDSAKRLFQISSEKTKMFKEGTVKDSDIIRLDNEIADITTEISVKLNQYRNMLKDKTLRASEEKRMEAWQEARRGDKDLPDEAFAPNIDVFSRPVTDYQQSLLKGEIKPHTLTPEGYRAVSVRDVYYRAKAIGEDMADLLIKDMLEQSNLTSREVKDVIARTDPDIWVIPEEVAKTFDEMTVKVDSNIVTKGIRGTTRGWKKYILFAPHRAFPFIANNTIGDTSYMLGAIHKSMLSVNAFKRKYASTALGELFSVAKGKKPSSQLREFLEMGGEDVGISVQEVGHVQDHPRFKGFRNETAIERIMLLPKWYMDRVFQLNTLTETARRYTLYKYYLDELKAGKTHYGSSKREFIDGLPKVEQKAFVLANDDMVAYNMVSSSGKALRDTLFPFFSFQEGNIKRFFHRTRNIYLSEKEASKIVSKLLPHLAKSGVKVASKTTVKAALFYVKMAWLMAGLSAYNRLFHPEEEEALSEDRKSRPHIITSGKDGKVTYRDTYDSLYELVNWVGLDEFPRHAKDYINGKASMKDIMTDMAYSPINKTANMISPIIKTPAELYAGKSTFPDIRRGFTIRDTGEALASVVALRPEYRAARGLPQESYSTERVKGITGFKTVDVLEGAYRDIRSAVSKYNERRGRPVQTFTVSDKGKALYNYKLALRYKNKEQADKFLKQYYEYGGSEKGMMRSLDTLHPLSGIAKKDRDAFTKTLTPRERDKLNKALKYYNDVLRQGMYPQKQTKQGFPNIKEEARKRIGVLDAFK